VNGRVAIVGSLNADLVVRTERRPAGGETVIGSDLAVGSGGKGANQAVAAARLGAEVAMLGALGDDAFGRRLRDAIRAEGIDDSAVLPLPDTASGTAMIIVDAAGENSIVVSPGANQRLSPAMVDERRSWFDGAAVLGLCLEVPVETVLAAARHGRGAGATVIVNLSPFAAVPAELLALTDLLLVNEHELALLLEETDRSWPERARALAGRGIGRAVVTLGSEGSVVLDPSGPEPAVTPIPAVRVTAVDTTGCGDAYTGSVAAALARGLPLTEAAAVASRVSAFAATRAGAQSSYPSRAEAAELAWA
jgi:ribokinase